MSEQLKVTLGLACTIVMLAISSSIASDRPYSSLGKLATAEEVAGWDIDVRLTERPLSEWVRQL